jgi:hypothetical protein
MNVFPLSAAVAGPSLRHRFRLRIAQDPRNWNLTLKAAGTAVPVQTVMASPTLLMVAVEDLCWGLAIDDLESRKPRRWRRSQRTAWDAEQAALEAKRTRIAAMAFEEVNAT